MTGDFFPDLTGMGTMGVKGIKVWAYHGALEFERLVGQEFIVDVDWWGDSSAATNSDSLVKTIDYGQVASLVADIVGGESFNLIETLAKRVADAVIEKFGMDLVHVTVHKPNAPLEVEFEDVVYTTFVGARNAPKPIRQAVFSLGSNIEPRREYLQFALTALATTPGIENIRVSPVYMTGAVGDIEQDDFLNAVVIADTDLPSTELVRRGLAIEEAAHRTRDIEHGPRTLDVDLIRVGDEVSDSLTLTLPHPRAHERAFVLVPWLALDPDATLPGLGRVAPYAAGLHQRIRPQAERLFLPS